MSAAAKPVMQALGEVDDHLQALMHYAHSHDLREAMSTVQGLLDVLQTIVRVADGRTLPGNLILDENSPLMDAARDALAKATGSAQC